MTPSRIVAISDFCSHVPPQAQRPEAKVTTSPAPRALPRDIPVVGGYLERLPLAAVRAGWVQSAEVWNFTGSDDDDIGVTSLPCGLDLRRFRAEGHPAPYASRQMAAHLRAFGAPDYLCIWGLGITAEMMSLCPNSIRIYNSLDVDALRIPVEVSRHIDIFLCGSDLQVSEVHRRHPHAIAAILPIGPEFASGETFFPLGLQKSVDVIYVAAAQAYKRHDILFDALAELPCDIRALCVMGYGEDACALRADAAARGLNVTFVGPPGVSHDEVNRLMNTARIGIVCGVDDGAPAILTEYMLAGLPVLANDALRCGLQYIRPDTGMTAPAHRFAEAIAQMLAMPDRFNPRAAVLGNWTWEQSIRKLAGLVHEARSRRATQGVVGEYAR
jgi:glycosyltransferase involved in cell wall biosynthesis